MGANRYLNVVLTIIAAELGWIALTHSGVPVSAQQKGQPVVITGVEMRPDAMVPVAIRGVELRDSFMPVGVLGQVPDNAGFRPLDIRAAATIKIDTDRPIRVEADPPLKVQIPVVTSPVPGIK